MSESVRVSESGEEGPEAIGDRLPSTGVWTNAFGLEELKVFDGMFPVLCENRGTGGRPRGDGVCCCCSAVDEVGADAAYRRCCCCV